MKELKITQVQKDKDAMCSKNASDVLPDNGQLKYEKDVRNPREIITIITYDWGIHLKGYCNIF